MDATCTQMNLDQEYRNKPFIGRAEENSHALAGPHASPIASAFSHVLGYAFTPFRDVLDYVIPDTKISRIDGALAQPVYQSVPNKVDYSTFSKHRKPLIKPTMVKNRRKPRPRRPLQRGKKKMEKKIERKVERKVISKIKRGPPRRRYARSGVTVGSGQRLVQRRIHPPVSDGYVLNVGPTMLFSPSRPGCLTMTGRYRLGPLASNASSQLAVSLSTNTINGAFPINPALTKYWPNSVATMSSMFERFSLSCQLEYIPKIATTNSGSLMMTFHNDAATVNDVYGITNDAGGGATLPPIMGNSAHTVEGPLYSRLLSRIFKSPPADDMKYIAGAQLYSASVNWAASAAGLRDQIAGAFILALNGAPVSTTFGDLYIRFRLTLCDMIIQPVTSSFLTERALRSSHHETLVSKASSIIKMLDAYEKTKPPSRSSSRSREGKDKEEDLPDFRTLEI